MSESLNTKSDNFITIDPTLSAKLSSKQTLTASLNKKKFKDDDEDGFIPESKFKSDKKSALTQQSQLNRIGTIQKSQTVQSEAHQIMTPDQGIALSPVILKQIKKNQMQFGKQEVDRIEEQLTKDFKFYRGLVIITMIFSLLSVIGVAIVALKDEFDLGLVPVSFWMGFMALLMTMMFDVQRTRNPDNHRLSIKSLIIGLAGNVLILLYYCVRVIQIYPDGKDKTVSNFVAFLAYILVFFFTEIIFLILMLPEASKAQRLFDHRENLLSVLYPKEMNVYSV
jgi:uncharacterized membrane protein YidH (DUF202 family)